MPDREKVIRGLEACALKQPFVDCKNCPYHGGYTCIGPLMCDALALLREQEPRVMTVEEIRNDCVEVFYFETRAGVLRGCVKELSDILDTGIVFLICGFDDDIFSFEFDSYGVTWRAWTHRPSPEQMLNTPWDVSLDQRVKWQRDDEIADGVGQAFSPD